MPYEIQQAMALKGTQRFTPNVGAYRWRVCALLFFATTINYIDRQVLGILAPQLQKDLHWSDSHYGLIITSFQAAYAIGFLFMGHLMDKIGSRIGYILSVGIWSIAAILHAFVRTIFGFASVRFGLGLGEAGNFPAAIKVTTEWFPKSERSFANGIFVSGASVGAIIAPFLVPFIAIRFGWQWAFILTGLLGFVWLIFWIAMYRSPQDHPHFSKEELTYIRSDPTEPSVEFPWIKLFAIRQTWAFAIGKFLTDPVFSFFFFFLPKFFYTQHGVTLDKIGPPIMVIYLMSDAGSIIGGWMSSFLIKKGFSVNRSRKTTMLIAALCVTPVYFASQTQHLWVAVALTGLAMAAHSAWSANLFTISSDMFPQRAVGSVVGIGSMIGAIGGMFGATLAGFLLESTGSYSVLFGVAGIVYLIAFGLIQLLAPDLKSVVLSGSQKNL